MSLNYQVNIAISSGCDFGQTFYLANPDKSPMDITGCTFKGAISKHSNSIDAVLSTSETPVYKFIPLQTSVVDGTGGVYEIFMPASDTKKLEEGKYFFNVVLIDLQGFTREVVSGLAFVERSMASVS